MKRRIITTVDFGPNSPQLFEAGHKVCSIHLLKALNFDGMQFVLLGVGVSNPAMKIGPDTIKAIHQKLSIQVSEPYPKFGVIEDPNVGHDSFHIPFQLLKGKSFCYSAIHAVSRILCVLDIPTAIKFDMIHFFGINQETQVKYMGEWVNYSQYLLLTHPILLRTDS